jgi:hypothetical protein
MKKTPLLTIVAACALAASSGRASLNLVQDPGFEGGETGTVGFSSSPWFNPSGNSDVVINNSDPHSGSFNAALTSQTGESAILLQNLTLTPGIGYVINFWLATPGGGPTPPPSLGGGTLSVDLNGVLAGTVTLGAGSVYTQYNLTATPADSTGVLSFIWNTTTAPSTLYLDDVSVAVPEPTTMVAGALMLLPFAASTFRLRKKTSA